jgi:hypothetical protein
MLKGVCVQAVGYLSPSHTLCRLNVIPGASEMSPGNQKGHFSVCFQTKNFVSRLVNKPTCESFGLLWFWSSEISCLITLGFTDDDNY